MTNTKNETTEKVVLIFTGQTGSRNPAKVHVESCSTVTRAVGKPGAVVITDDVPGEVADLFARGYFVKICPCAKHAAKWDSRLNLILDTEVAQ